MSTGPQIRVYEYIELPYERVRAALRERPIALFQRATASAVSRAETLAATLTVGTSGIRIGVDVHVRVTKWHEEPSICGLWPVTTLSLEWQAEEASALFPRMQAELTASPIGADETQLLLEGEYKTPLGVLGKVADAAIGHRVAEAAIHRFLREIVAQILAETRAVSAAE